MYKIKLTLKIRTISINLHANLDQKIQHFFTFREIPILVIIMILTAKVNNIYPRYVS